MFDNRTELKRKTDRKLSRSPEIQQKMVKHFAEVFMGEFSPDLEVKERWRNSPLLQLMD